MSAKLWLMLGGVLFILSGLCGCGLLVVGGAAGAGVYSYVEGEVQRTYDVSMGKALAAARKAAKDLRFTENGAEEDTIKTILKYKKTDNTEVTIRVERKDRKLTEIGVRVGYVGVWDTEQAKTIHNYISENLKR
jgi:hypothetical protein